MHLTQGLGILSRCSSAWVCGQVLNKFMNFLACTRTTFFFTFCNIGFPKRICVSLL